MKCWRLSSPTGKRLPCKLRGLSLNSGGPVSNPSSPMGKKRYGGRRILRDSQVRETDLNSWENYRGQRATHKTIFILKHTPYMHTHIQNFTKEKKWSIGFLLFFPHYKMLRIRLTWTVHFNVSVWTEEMAHWLRALGCSYRGWVQVPESTLGSSQPHPHIYAQTCTRAHI